MNGCKNHLHRLECHPLAIAKNRQFYYEKTKTDSKQIKVSISESCQVVFLKIQDPAESEKQGITKKHQKIN